MEELLISAGLSKLQAKAYLYLLKTGPSLPYLLSVDLKMTRTNAYKVLESLEKLGLVTRQARQKKITFVAEDPIALASLVAERRNSIIALEQNVNNVMQQLRSAYGRGQKSSRVRTSTGKNAMVKEYEEQAEQHQPIYFIKSRADVPFMGFDIMDPVRKIQIHAAPERYGITTDSPEAFVNPELDKKNNLNRTWINESDYTAPVEWSLSGNNLIIQIFDGEGRTVTIEDLLIAESFRQLWRLLDKSVRASTSYQALPHKAKRNV